MMYSYQPLGLDRTYEELKPRMLRALLKTCICLDRTYEELKLATGEHFRPVSSLFGSYL